MGLHSYIKSFVDYYLHSLTEKDVLIIGLSKLIANYYSYAVCILQ